MTSVICEVFDCTPDVARRQNVDECLRIMQLRQYRDVKHAIESSTKDHPAPEAITNSRMARIWNECMGINRGLKTLAEAEQALKEV